MQLCTTSGEAAQSTMVQTSRPLCTAFPLLSWGSIPKSQLQEEFQHLSVFMISKLETTQQAAACTRGFAHGPPAPVPKAGRFRESLSDQTLSAFWWGWQISGETPAHPA